MSGSRTKLSTVVQRVEWLLLSPHRHFLVGTREPDVRRIALAMKADGLLAKSTYWPDATRGIKEAVRQARLHWYWEHNGRGGGGHTMTKLRVVIEAVLVLCLALLVAKVYAARQTEDHDHLDRYVVTVACPAAPEPIQARSRLWALIQTTSATVWTEDEWKAAYMTCLRESDEPHKCGHLYPQFKANEYRVGK